MVSTNTSNDIKKKISLLAPIFILMVIFLACQEKPIPYTQKGEASYYANMFEGRITASGAPYRKDSLTAAHRHLPLGTVVKVTNLENNHQVTVEINDRGPYSDNRIIDLSRSAAKKLKMINPGIADVKLEVVEPAPGYSVSDSVEI